MKALDQRGSLFVRGEGVAFDFDSSHWIQETAGRGHWGKIALSAQAILKGTDSWRLLATSTGMEAQGLYSCKEMWVICCTIHHIPERSPLLVLPPGAGCHGHLTITEKGCSPYFPGPPHPFLTSHFAKLVFFTHNLVTFLLPSLLKTGLCRPWTRVLPFQGSRCLKTMSRNGSRKHASNPEMGDRRVRERDAGINT